MNRTNVFPLAVVGNLLALPMYWQAIGPLTVCFSRNMDTQMLLALAAALVAGAAAAWAWSRSARAGAAVQLLVVLPVVIRLAVDWRGMSPKLHLADFADSRFIFAVVLILAFGVLAAIPVIVLARVRAHRHDD